MKNPRLDRERRRRERMQQVCIHVNSLNPNTNLHLSCLARAPDPGSISDQLRDEAATAAARNNHENEEQRHEDEEQAGFTPLGEREPLQPLADDFVPHVEELKIALEFQQALKHASLDNGDLDTESLARLRNPPQTLFELPDPDVLLSLKLFISTTNASNQTYTDVCADIADVHPEITPLSHAAIKKEIAAISGVVPIIHDMCPNSCLAYTGPYAELQACPMCGETRYDLLAAAANPEKKKTSRQHFYTIPLGPQLQALWRTPEGAHNMRHRYRCTNKIVAELNHPNSDGYIKQFNDIYHGSEYLEAVARGDIKTDDMVLMFSMDGAQLYQDKTSDCWIYIWVIFDLPPHMRYKKKHVLPGGFIPGPNNPKNTDSFLFPGFHHLAALQKEGLRVWDASENRLLTSYIFLYLGGADGPGSVHFTGLVGHHGAYPCRLYCDLKGRHKPGTPFYYPTLLKPNDYSVNGCDHPDVSVNDIHGGSPEEYQKNLIYLLNSRNPTNYKDRRKETGISNSSIFSGLSAHHRLPIPAGFPGDAMHSTTLNFGELLPPLWRGLFQCAPTDNVANWPWVVLTGDVWKKHGEAVARARQYMPGSYDRPPRNIAEKISSGYKAKEWQSYLYGLAPALLRDILPFDIWQNFCKLVHGVRLLLQLDIPQSQVREGHKMLQSFFTEFELLYVQRRTDRIHFVRPCLHSLLHMGPETVRVGPINLYSAWTMERVVGDLGSEIGQPSNPYQNLSERGLRRCQTNALKAIYPSLDRTKTALPRGSLDLGDGYVLLRAKEEYAYLIEGDEGRVIKSYILEQETLLGNEAPVNWAGPRLSKWARLLLPTGQIARSAWKETLKAPEDLRQSRCIKVSSPCYVNFCSLQSYCLHPAPYRRSH